MKNIITLSILLSSLLCLGQSLPIDFEADITTENFIDFDGGTATVIDNPQMNGINTSAKVAQIVRDGGAIWAGSKIDLTSNLDFSTDNKLSMKVFTTAPIGTVVKFKLEGNGSDERDVVTTLSNEWEELTWDFTGVASDYNSVVFMFDFGNTGNGSEASTFLFDDINQIFGGSQIDLPVDFESEEIDYTLTDFEGNRSMLVQDPTDESNTVVQCSKTFDASPSAGTTIGTPSGFASNIPLTLENSKMTVRVWTPSAGIPVRLKVEDSNDPTHTCETETNSISAGWQTLEFDFINQAPGTELLSIGLQMGWTYNMASIFFNFATSGADDGGQLYYFDDVQFGGLASSIIDFEKLEIDVTPNPTQNDWTLSSNNDFINTIELYSTNGALLMTYNNVGYQFSIPSRHLEANIYIAKVRTEKGMGVVRLIKQ